MYTVWSYVRFIVMYVYAPMYGLVPEMQRSINASNDNNDDKYSQLLQCA